MKTWRWFLIVVLALLLPLRGAVAGAMLCAPAGHGDAAHAHHDAGPADHGAHDAHETHDAQDTHEMDDAHDVHQAGDGETCNACASYCSLTPLASAPPHVRAPGVAATLSYPAWSAPSPSFLRGGQERPPRST